MSKKIQQGYTLIELLLVVAIISLIASLSIKAIRDKALSERINIASLNIQHVLEAAMAYNVAIGTWPEENVNDCSRPSINDNFVNDYLPNQNFQSNYGTPFCWSGNDSSGKPLAPRFWVAMLVPNGDSSTAKRIASRLPNAIITSDLNNITNQCTNTACYVRAEVAQPSQTSNAQSGIYVASQGYCDPEKTLQRNMDGSYTFSRQLGANKRSSYCQRTTLYDQFEDRSGGYASHPSLGQYQIVFQCKPGEQGAVNAIPAFLTMSRNSKGYVDPLYKLIVTPSDGGDCNTDPATGRVSCKETVVVSYNYEGAAPVEIILGCRSEYAALNLCQCEAFGCEDKPGDVGLAYSAICMIPNRSMMRSSQKHFW